MKRLHAVAMTLILLAGPALAGQPFVRTGVPGPVVADSLTGLVWQGCAAGLTGDACTGTPTTMSWADAVAYCDGLTWASKTDWYLPDPKELRSLVDNRRSIPAIDPVAFPATPSSWFRTSSSYAYDTADAWVVYFDYGLVSHYGKSSSYSVRCVRGGP